MDYPPGLVLTTGGTGGLGRVVITDLLSEGYQITNIHLQPIPWLKSLPQSQSGLFQSVEQDLAKLDPACLPQLLPDPTSYTHIVLLHGQCQSQPLLKITPDDFLLSLEVNFLSHFWLMQYFLAAWSEAPIMDRSIVYISSVAAKCGAGCQVPYLTAKRAGEGAVLAAAREFASRHIRANVISPGVMDTPMGQHNLAERPDLLDRVPLGEMVSPAEISRLIVYLMQQPHVTGQNISINGGRWMNI